MTNFKDQNTKGSGQMGSQQDDTTTTTGSQGQHDDAGSSSSGNKGRFQAGDDYTRQMGSKGGRADRSR